MHPPPETQKQYLTLLSAIQQNCTRWWHRSDLPRCCWLTIYLLSLWLRIFVANAKVSKG